MCVCVCDIYIYIYILDLFCYKTKFVKKREQLIAGIHSFWSACVYQELSQLSFHFLFISKVDINYILLFCVTDYIIMTSKSPRPKVRLGTGSFLLSDI